MKRLKRAAAASMVLGHDLGQELGGPWRVFGRIALTLGLGALFVWLLSQRLSELDFDQLHAAAAHLSAVQWLGAALCTAAAFGAVGYYDAVLHRHFQTGTDQARARRAGICAIAVSQTLGLGVVTGAVLRWRMLPEQSFLMATKLTVAVAGSFLAGWAVVTSAALIVLPDAPYKTAAMLILGVAGAGAALSLIAPRWSIRWPNAFTMTRLISLAAVDMLAAAAALYVLLGGSVDFAALLPAFLLAYGAGLISGAPGGIGAFEITLLALLPHVDAPQLMAGVLAWRLVYFVIPALIGAAVAMRGPRDIQTAADFIQPRLENPLAMVRAERGIIAQGQHTLTLAGRAHWVTARTGHTLAALFDPEGAQDAHALSRLAAIARSEGRVCTIYKAGPRLAVAARRHGWAAMICAREAVIDTAAFNLGSPLCAGLRRKLRRAHAAGIDCAHVDDTTAISWPQLDNIAADWAQAHGGERGFSMGRYTRSYVADQRLYIAYQNGAACAFVTFHTGAGYAGAGEWTLDLMRHGAGVADGTMHALVAFAIADAAKHGVPRVSLAAVSGPAFRAANGTLWRIFKGMRAADTGLLRFKDSFSPRWEGRYVLAPNWPALMLGCASIARAVFWPAPLTDVKTRPKWQFWLHRTQPNS